MAAGTTNGVASARGAGRSLADWLPTSLLLPLAWLVMAPVAILLVSAFKPTGFLFDPGFTTEHFGAVWLAPETWALLWRSLVFALGSSVFALLAGGVLAWLTERTDIPGAGAIRVWMLLPMAIPPFLLAIGWIMLASPRTGALNRALSELFGFSGPVFDIYTMEGMIFVEALALAPSAYLIMAPAFRLLNPSLEEAALMSGASRLKTLTRIVLPMMAPAIAGTTVYLLVVSLIVFDVPGTIGVPAGVKVFSTHIYDLLNHSPTGLPEYGAIGAIAAGFMFLLVFLALAYQRIMRQSGRYVSVTGKAVQARPFALGRWRWPAAVFAWAYILVSAIAPMVVLLWTSLLPWQMPLGLDALRSLTLANHLQFLSDPALLKALGHSLVIAVVASTVTAALALVCSWTLVRSRAPARGLIDLLTFLPLAFPGVLIATALIYLYLTFRPAPIYGTIWIICVAHLTMYLSYASRVTNAAVAQLHPELEEAARMSGAGWMIAMRRVVAPLAAPALLAVWIWIFSHSLRELGAALLLQGADNKTVPTLLFSYWTQGQPTKTAAVGVWLVVVMAALIALGAAVQKRVRSAP
jgi:iron(III) transport system permease protein